MTNVLLFTPSLPPSWINSFGTNALSVGLEDDAVLHVDEDIVVGV